jgi:hypothetical protein
LFSSCVGSAVLYLRIDVLDTVVNTVIQSRLCYTYMYFTFRYTEGVTGTSATFIIHPSVITADRLSLLSIASMG